MKNHQGAPITVSKNDTKPSTTSAALIHAVHQQPSDLVLALLGSSLPVPVTVLAQGECILGSFHFEFNIIGESHLVNVAHRGKTVFRELLACVPLAPEACRLYHPFHDLRGFSTTHNSHRVEIAFEGLPTSAEALSAFLQQHSAPLLEVTFPKIHGCIPVTRLWWHKNDDSIHWRTLHVYPGTELITTVWSMSSFSVGDYHF
ncbi:MAG: DUF2617 family protein [Anaerolineae bacterium]|nr:DUF2617 family protein [Anaerolineae bacterium]